MNKDLTEIAFVLDRSGSMSNLTEQAVSAFNAFLRDQQAAEGSANLTLVLFDDEYLVPINAVPISEVVSLTAADYEPRGSTALLDAIGRTINEVGSRLANTPEPQRPGTVIVAIFTDGYENASTEFTWRSVSELIKHQQDAYKWEFLFLGANQDAIATAANLNIASSNASGWAADGVGLHASTASIARKAKALRSRASGKMTMHEEVDLCASMESMVSEEDSKRRKE